MASLKLFTLASAFVLLLALLTAMLNYGICEPKDLTVLLLFSLISSAAYIDLTSHRIPNWLTYGTVLVALGWQAVIWIMAWQQSEALSWQDSLLGGTLCGGLMFGLWKLKAIGGGDVKLAFALGLLMGLGPAVTGILLAHLLAASFVVAWLVARGLVASGRLVVPNGWRSRLQMNQRLTGSTRLPMAGFYAGGVLLVMWVY